MRKFVIIIIILSFVLFGCTTQRTESIIKDISQNSNFKYQMLTEVTEEITSEFSVMEGFGMRILVDSSLDPSIDDISEYMDNNPTTYYHVTAYPDYMNGGSYITRIETSDPEIFLYDLSVGDEYNRDEINEYMKSLGFKPDDTIASAYVNQRVKINIYLVNDVITKLIVQVIVTNKTRMIF